MMENQSGMYNSDGTFRPLTANEGNISGELGHFRNVFMEAERQYFEKLLEDELIYEYFMTLSQQFHGEDLIRETMKLQEKLEFGELESKEELEKMKMMTPEQRDQFHMEKLERTEGMICLLYAAARDKEKILELVRTFHSRTR